MTAKDNVNELQTLMRELEARDAREREEGLPPAQRMRALVPEAGRFIHSVIRACRFKRILEIGTSYGYSTLWLASAARAVGGHVDTLELSAERAAAARAHFARAGLSGVIRQHEGDAQQLIPQLAGEYDFIFIDAEKDDYERYLELSRPLIARGGIIMADNVLSHADQLGHYIEKAQHTSGLFSVTVPVGRGEEMSLRAERSLPSEVIALLAELEVFGRTHANARNVPRDAGKLLNILARAAQAKTVIELGAATAYAGLWLGAAVAETGGRVLSVEPEAAKHKAANEIFARAKLAQHVRVMAGQPREVLRALDGTFDFAFINAQSADDDFMAALWPKLADGALLIADQAQSGDAPSAYTRQMRARPDALSAALDLGGGMLFTLKVMHDEELQSLR